MKKILSMLLILFVAVAINLTTVSAFSITDVNLSNDIDIYKDEDGKYIVELPASLSAYNASIGYQFIKQSDLPDGYSFSNFNDNFEQFQSCVVQVAENGNYDVDAENFEDSESYAAYMEAIQTTCGESLASLYALVPIYGENNWVNQSLGASDASKAIYTIVNSDNDVFALWVKAKDASESDIYQIEFLNTDDIADSDEQDGSEDSNIPDTATTDKKGNKNSSVKAPNTSLTKSILIPGIGVCCIAASIVIIMKYRNKSKKKDI